MTAIPANWRELVAALPDGCGTATVAAALGLDADQLYYQRRKNPDLNAACRTKLAVPNAKTLTLPADWAARIAALPEHCGVTKLAVALGLEPLDLYKLRKRNEDLDTACRAKRGAPSPSIRPFPRRQRKASPRLPDDWLERIAALPDRCGVAAICEALQLKQYVFDGLRKTNQALREACSSKLVPPGGYRKPAPPPSPPTDWRTRLAAVPNRSGVAAIATALGLRRQEDVWLLRKANAEFDEACQPKVIPKGAPGAPRQKRATTEAPPARRHYTAKVQPLAMEVDALVAELDVNAMSLAAINSQTIEKDALSIKEVHYSAQLQASAAKTITDLLRERREIRTKLNEAQALNHRLRSGGRAAHARGGARN